MTVLEENKVRITIYLNKELREKAHGAVARAEVRSLSEYVENATRSALHLPPRDKTLPLPSKRLGRLPVTPPGAHSSHTITLSKEIIDIGRFLARRGKTASFSAFVNEAIYRYENAKPKAR